MTVSVLILTKNEEQDLPACLASFSWCDDVHVYDSMSTDNTVKIAKEFGAKVTSRPFDTESVHKNWALQNIEFKYDWIYQSDADEILTPELQKFIIDFPKQPHNYSALRVKRRDYLYGTWLKHSTPSPFNIRLFKLGKLRYERLTNPVSIVDGETADTDEYFNHYPFSKGIAHWFDKHNRYSNFEAQQIISNRTNQSDFSIVKALFSNNANEKRFHQKELYYRLPFRPLIMFCLIYFFKLGFLDGKSGFVFSVLRSIYEYMIVLKVNEINSSAKKK